MERRDLGLVLYIRTVYLILASSLFFSSSSRSGRTCGIGASRLIGLVSGDLRFPVGPFYHLFFSFFFSFSSRWSVWQFKRTEREGFSRGSRNDMLNGYGKVFCSFSASCQDLGAHALCYPRLRDGNCRRVSGGWSITSYMSPSSVWFFKTLECERLGIAASGQWRLFPTLLFWGP